MYLAKKLSFAPLFLICFYLTLSQSKPFLDSVDSFFRVTPAYWQSVAIFVGLIMLTSLFFVLFVTLSQDWRIIAPILLASNLISFLVFANPLNLVMAVGFLTVGGLIYVLLDNKLKTYLNFQPGSLLSSSVVNFSKLLVFLFSLALFFNLSAGGNQKPFQVPDQIIDSVLQMLPQETPQQSTNPKLNNAKLPKEQLDLLQNNPELLQQFGLNAKNLDSLNLAAGGSPTDLIKKTVSDQVNKFLEPYQTFVPAIFSFLFFTFLTSIVSLASLLVSPLLWLIFFSFEQTGFTKYIKEMREVKKLVV